MLEPPPCEPPLLPDEDEDCEPPPGLGIEAPPPPLLPPEGMLGELRPPPELPPEEPLLPEEPPLDGEEGDEGMTMTIAAADSRPSGIRRLHR